MYKLIKKNKLKYLSILIIISLFIIIINKLIIRAENQNNLDISLSYGYGNSIKQNKFLPINLKIKNIKQDLNAKLIIDLDSINSTSYKYIYPINLKKEGEYKKTYPIYIDKDNIDIKIKICTDNQELYKDNIQLENEGKKNELIVGVLSDTKEKLRYFDNLKLNYGLLNTKLVELDTESFPDDSINLEQLDLIVISNYRIRDLSYEKSMALMDWVKNGGIMILGTGFRVADTLGRYSPELLDEMYDKPYLRDLNLRISGKEDRYVSLYVLNLLIHGGNIILSDGDFPIISSVNRGKGKIIVSAYDFVDLSDYMEKNDEYITNLLTRALGINYIESLTDKVDVKASEYLDIKALLSVIDPSRLPNLGIYFIIITIYILLSGPVLFILLKQAKLSNLYTKLIIIFSIFFSIIIYILGNMTRYQGIFYTYAGIIDVNEDYISKKIFLNINNPYNKDYCVKIDNSYSYQGIKDNFNSDNKILSKDKIILENFDNDTNIEFLNNQAFQNHIFKLERREGNPDKIGLTGYINLVEDKVSGYIENSYDFDLSDVVILFYSKLVKLGDIKSHEIINLDNAELINIPLNRNVDVAKYINTSQNDKNNLEQRILDFQRINLMAFYMNNFFVGYTQDAKILAFSKFSKNEIEDKFIDKGNKRGLSLYISNLNVDNKNGDLIYRQALIKNPNILRGEYYPNTNTYYAKESLVLEYYLGEDVDIQGLVFENISSKLGYNIINNSFKGNIYIYDYNQEKFVKKEPDKNYYTKEELEDYLSDNNSIRLRYSSNLSDLDDMYVSLPMLSIVARQK